MALFTLKELIVYLSSLVLLFIGFFGMKYYGLPYSLLVFPANSTTLLITIIMFSFGLLFFGYGSPIVSFFAGIFYGWIYKVTGIPSSFVIFGMLSAVIILIATVKMGLSLFEDLTEKGNFRESLKVSFISIASALIICIVTDYLVVTL